MYYRTLQESSADINHEVKQCALFGSFSYTIQGILGLLSFMILISKPEIFNLVSQETERKTKETMESLVSST